MNSLAEGLGMSLPGCASIPAPLSERGEISYRTGLRIVDMVKEDLTPSKILTRKAFENSIVLNSAIGGSTNAPIHINAIARHVGVILEIEDWEKVGLEIKQADKKKEQEAMAAEGRGRRLPLQLPYLDLVRPLYIDIPDSIPAGPVRAEC